MQTVTASEKLTEKLKAILGEVGVLALGDGRYVLGGSGPLMLRGLRHVNDVDLFVKRSVYEDFKSTGDWQEVFQDPNDEIRKDDPPYLARMVGDVPVNIFYDWKRRGFTFDVGWHLANPEHVAGVPCVSLNFILEHKRWMGRVKDKADITMIEHYLIEGMS